MVLCLKCIQDRLEQFKVSKTFRCGSSVDYSHWVAQWRLITPGVWHRGVCEIQKSEGKREETGLCYCGSGVGAEASPLVGPCGQKDLSGMWVGAWFQGSRRLWHLLDFTPGAPSLYTAVQHENKSWRIKSRWRSLNVTLSHLPLLTGKQTRREGTYETSHSLWIGDPGLEPRLFNTRPKLWLLHLERFHHVETESPGFEPHCSFHNCINRCICHCGQCFKEICSGLWDLGGIWPCLRSSEKVLKGNGLKSTVELSLTY